MEIVRKQLTPDDISSPTMRFNVDEDVFEVFNGATWQPAPTLDPRTNPGNLLPPLTGDDIRCRAAAGMTELIRQAVDQRIEDATAIELAGSIMGIVAFIPGFNVMYALMVALATFGFTIAREILEAAFTEDVYEDILCAFFCSVDEDGVMTPQGFIDAKVRLSGLNPVAFSWVENV